MPWILLLLFFGGACLGSLVNLGIYRLAYLRRRISPWSLTHGELPRRGWLDRIPIVGWFSLRREEKIHGPGFWIRPMLLEWMFALGVPALYWLEVEKFFLNTSPLFPGLRPSDPRFLGALQVQFAIHAVLLAFMAVATFIDIDEQTIPDVVSVPGTVIALLLAALCTSPAVPALQLDLNLPSPADLVRPLRFDYPTDHAIGGGGFLDGWSSLIVGLAIYLVWCFALLPRRWRSGVGIGQAWRVMWRRIAARPEWVWVMPLAIAGAMFILSGWARGIWHGLMSALVGMAVGAGMIWMIRVIGGVALKQEAVGFGDVTLMAMIGAFLGWQAVIIVFFIAPFVGAVFGIVQWLLIRQNVLPYGPFLCLGALLTMLFWAPLWNYASAVFEIPWLVPTAIIVCLPLLAGLLYGWRLLKDKLNKK
ncbi:MAG TPA: A24 family peptidase [Pirellulales bacterium]|jgi:prepilin signal peptidase PulO-like enzyme (type II secretory pathway)